MNYYDNAGSQDKPIGMLCRTEGRLDVYSWIMSASRCSTSKLMDAVAALRPGRVAREGAASGKT